MIKFGWPIEATVIKLILAMICALGLAFSPVAANAAPAAASEMPGCTMDGDDMPDMPADHLKMDCCTPACQAPSAAASLPRQGSGLPSTFASKLRLVWAPAKVLTSVWGSVLDPPPRA